jgi:hypothetical protein
MVASMNRGQLPWVATITTSRYSGAYEGGRWVCFRAFHDELPSAPFEDDITAQAWWSDGEEETWVGRGDSPQEAFEDMMRRWRRMGCSTCLGDGMMPASTGSSWTACVTCKGAGRGPRPLAP